MDIEQLHGEFLRSAGACTDTRKLTPGGMFFALRGPSFDANAFAGQALEHGCAKAVVDDPAIATDDRFILVPDVLSALQQLARHHRRTFDIPFIAITGTNGKTTTKELLHAVLAADRPTLATEGNLNNHIGVPLTLLKVKPEHRIAIIEMGASKLGDIAELCAIAEPTKGLITNIGKAHLEGFGSVEGVIRTKTELYAWLREHHGLTFVNGDDALLMGKSEGINRETYGTGVGTDLQGKTKASGTPFLHVEFEAADQSTSSLVETHLIGDYNTSNVLAAICIGRHFHIADGVMKDAIGQYAPANSRSQFKDTGRNELVLDAYNANPTSMAAALENFAQLPSDRKKLVILGDMRELGESSMAEHASIIQLVRKLELDALFIGKEFMKAAPEVTVRRAKDVNAALEVLKADPPRGQLILVKGSRGVRLEEMLGTL